MPNTSERLSAIPSCGGLITRLACARARKLDIDLPQLLHRAGLTVKEIDDDENPLSVPSQIDCLNRIAEVLGDRCLGFHIGQSFDLRAAGSFYYVAASADILGDGLQHFSRYSAIVNEGIKLKVEIGNKMQVNFHYAGVSRQSDRHQIEAWITGLVRFCREKTGRNLRPTGVRIKHHRIPESKKFDDFLGCTAQFEADTDEVRFAAEAAKLPIISADPYLNRLLMKYCEDVLSDRKVPSGPLRTTVENVTATLMPHGQARVDTVAQKLGMSSRTLRRRLSDEGCSFAQIVQDLRIGLAERYLAERNLPISRIAWLLGYTEVSGFSHAFRRWTGKAPRANRARQSPLLAPAARK